MYFLSGPPLVDIGTNKYNQIGESLINYFCLNNYCIKGMRSGEMAGR